MPLKFTLQDTLDSAGFTKYQLQKASGVRPNTISEICAGKSSRLSVETLDALIVGLNSLQDSKDEYGLDAIIVYETPGTP